MHPCAACGYLVFTAPAGSMQTCPVCGWIDDFDQLVHPDFVIGANGCSLREAQARAAGLSHEGRRDPKWRPLRKGEQPRTEYASEVCALGNPEREVFEPYWVAESEVAPLSPAPLPASQGEGES